MKKFYYSILLVLLSLLVIKSYTKLLIILIILVNKILESFIKKCLAFLNKNCTIKYLQVA